MAIIVGSGYLHFHDIKYFFIWSLCQLSFFQFYNPEFLRSFGVGVINGSLWTITVELQFYFLVPLMYFLSSKCFNWANRVKFFWILLIIALLCNVICGSMPIPIGHINTQSTNDNYLMYYKLLNISIIPYLYCFLMGVVVRLHLDKISKFVTGKFVYYLLGYTCFYLLFKQAITVDVYHPVIMVLLAFLVISFAFSFQNLSHFLQGNDFSYGIYIYHMLVINVFVFLGFTYSWYFFFLAILCTFLCAIFSWFVIEKPALYLKYNSLRAINAEPFVDYEPDEQRVIG